MSPRTDRPLTAPRLVVTPLFRMQPDVMRECELVRKRTQTPELWTDADSLELAKLRFVADKRQRALDAIAEANAEGCIPHYHDRPLSRRRREE
jgi:hypothetical protein